jgi:hypothetical protein
VKIAIARNDDDTPPHTAKYEVRHGRAVGKLMYRGMVFSGVVFNTPIIGGYFKVRSVKGLNLLFKDE